MTHIITTTCIEDKDGNMIMDQDKIKIRWFEYINELYKDDSRGKLQHIKPDTALKRMPKKKDPGPDGVLTEMLVTAVEYGLEELTMTTSLRNLINLYS